MSAFDLRLAVRRPRFLSRREAPPRRASRRGLAPHVERLEAIQLLSGTGTNTQSVSLPLQLIDTNPRAAAIPQFNPALGQLTSVQITVAGTVLGGAVAENLSAGTSANNMVTVLLSGGFSLSGPGLATALTDTRTVDASEQIGPFDGTADFMGTDTVTFDPAALTVANAASTTITNTADLAAFVGTGTLPYDYLPTSAASASETEGNLAFQVSSQASANISVVYTYTAQAISGFVYSDCLDNNGLRGPNEPGIAGVTLTLTGTDDLGPITPITATTDANGFYQFPNLRAGTYTVTEAQPAGLLDGLDTRGNVTALPNSVGTDAIDTITIGNGVDATENNFGELTPGAITGFVYVDLNGDGVRGQPGPTTGEPGVPNVAIALTGTNDLNQAVNLTATTDVNGFYQFPGLRPGSYTVTETQPAGLLDGLDTRGNVTPLPGSIGTDAIPITLAPCSTADLNNFGERMTSPGGTDMGNAQVSGTVFTDCLNTNGVQDPNEPGIAGVTVMLTGTDDRGAIVPRTTQTDASGNYVFPGLRAGTYNVTEIQPTGFLDGLDARAGVVLTGSASTDVIMAIVVSAGSTNPGNTFGELTPGAINGFVYQDDNLNGLKDAGEPGIANVMMRLSGNSDLGPIAPIDVLTDASGQYTFPGLRPGSYTITEVTRPTFQFDNLPPGFYARGLKTQGNLTPIPGSASQDFIPAGLASCSTLANYNFGERLPAGTITSCINVTPRTFGIHAQPTTIELAFSKAIDPAQATNLANYRLVGPGRDGRIGTRDDRTMPIRSATYNPATQTVTLAPASRLRLGQFFQLTVNGTNGVAGPSGGLMDLNGRCVSQFQTIFGRGNHFLFPDTDSDQIGLALRHGGLMEIYRAPDGGVRRIALYDTLPDRNRLDATKSLLRGHVIKGRTGDGLAQIPLVVGVNQVTNQLTDPPFIIGKTVDRTTNPPAIGLPRGHLALSLSRRHR